VARQGHDPSVAPEITAMEHPRAQRSVLQQRPTPAKARIAIASGTGQKAHAETRKNRSMVMLKRIRDMPTRRWREPTFEPANRSMIERWVKGDPGKIFDIAGLQRPPRGVSSERDGADRSAQLTLRRGLGGDDRHMRLTSRQRIRPLPGLDLQHDFRMSLTEGGELLEERSACDVRKGDPDRAPQRSVVGGGVDQRLSDLRLDPFGTRHELGAQIGRRVAMSPFHENDAAEPILQRRHPPDDGTVDDPEHLARARGCSGAGDH
jgi:hypothetical protein